MIRLQNCQMVLESGAILDASIHTAKKLKPYWGGASWKKKGYGFIFCRLTAPN